MFNNLFNPLFPEPKFAMPDPPMESGGEEEDDEEEVPPSDPTL